MAKKTHEQQVERFYSHGSKKRAHEADGFLSFGYRHNKKHDYFTAAENLLAYVLKKTSCTEGGVVLNVACGYGAETFRLYERLKATVVYAIDITSDHIAHAKKRAEEMLLSSKIIFEKGDACNLGYADNTFTQVIGIEGPAHFNTRQEFLRESFRTLQKRGSLILTDITINSDTFKHNVFKKIITRRGSKLRKMPKENWGSALIYKEKLQQVGFRIDMIEEIGGKVYEGFARYNFRWKSICNAIRQRGFFIGIGLTIISGLLWFGYRIGLIDYVVVKATKE